MSFLGNILTWISNAKGLDSTKAAAAQALAKAGQDLLTATKQHAPDMVNAVEQHVINAVTTAVTGALTRSK